VRKAVELGYRLVDTATIYGNEEGVGEALEGRDDIFLTTKVWNSDQGHDQTLRAFELSAGKLRREVIDLYLIHWPAPRNDRYVDTWRALVRLQSEGRIRSIGVSNFYPEHLERIIGETGVTPAVNQVELHPRFQQRSLRDVHQARAIATEAWSPLGQGQVLQDPVITRLASKHGRTPAQIIIRWHLDSGLIVIPKSSNPGRLAENLDVFGFVLDADDLAAIGALDDGDGRIGPDPMTAAF
ncbi:MAG: aldo/keto reductase, partial [Caulobacteraceae bacterium]